MKRFCAVLLFLLASAALAAPPKLVVVVSIDQFPSYYLTRYDNVLGDDGFKRLEREGTWFVNAAYPYATTFTGPGHASIGTGHTPSESGIIGNNWYDRAAHARMYCASDPRVDPILPPSTDAKVRDANRMSPLNLDAAGLGDRLQEHDRESKVYSVSLKDRAAILMGGRKAWGAFWFDPKAGFTTTTYYRHRLEPLLAEINKTLAARLKAHPSWTLDPATRNAHVTDPESLRGTKSDRYGLGTSFDHPIGSMEALTYTPYGNDLVLDFARQIIRRESLGADGHADLLFVSLSSNDYLGHLFGPDSWEAADAVVRTDRQLAAFLRELRAKLGDNVTVALTADHGVQPIPAVAKVKEPTKPAGPVDFNNAASPGRIDVEKVAAQKLGLSAPMSAIFWFEEPAFYLDFTKLPAGIDPEAAKRAYRDAALTIEGVSDAFTNSELMLPESAAESHDKKAMRLSFRADRSGDVLITLKPGYIWKSSIAATHGQPVPDDQRVPVILWGKGIVHGDEPCRARESSPLDLARTLGKLLGVDAGGAHSNDLKCARATD
jgi:predicted AlkP superfamily pyrophosphatase or phosphodiesterase